MQEHENTATRQAVEELLQLAEVTNNRKLVRTILETGLGLAEDNAGRLNLKITSAAIEEMRLAFRLFAPYVDTPKVSIFGSARTHLDDPLWHLARDVAAELSALDWMVVTGAGPGIMEAASTGAGPEKALGVSIRLPFEEAPNAAVHIDEHHVSMKYFFTRKLMLVKESRGFICLPGGFGTMDEVFELLTLQQTGKMIPVPIVLLDRPGGTYWTGFRDFVVRELQGTGMIAEGDLDRVLITHSIDEAIHEITDFWRNYDSLRWFDTELVFRLRETPTEGELASLEASFGNLFVDGRIRLTETSPAEERENDVPELPRVIGTPKRRAVGELHRIIRGFNALGSAPNLVARPSQ